MAAQIGDVIAGWQLRPGDQVPPEPELAAVLGVTRYQVRKGLAVLKRRGRLVQQRGAGTFVAAADTDGAAQRTFVIIGPFSPPMIDELGPLQQEAFARGFQVRLVNTCPVNQDPDHERSCLRQLHENPVAGVVIEPTPFAPSSFDLYEPLRLAGTKVAVLNCPPERVRDHAVFAMDCRKAGYMAAVHLGMSGWRRQCLVSRLTLPEQWYEVAFRDGVIEAAHDYGFDLEVVYARVELNETTCRLQWTADAQVPTPRDGIGYICGASADAAVLRLDLEAAGCRNVGLVCRVQERREWPFAVVLTDPVERYRRVLRYLLDAGVPATDHVHDVTEPELIVPSPQSTRESAP